VGTDFRIQPENITCQNQAQARVVSAWRFVSDGDPAGIQGVTMKSTSDILGRLQRLIPAGVQPKFTSAAELMAWQQEEGRKRAAELEKKTSALVLRRFLAGLVSAICTGIVPSQITR
jgi:hypothetical protein